MKKNSSTTVLLCGSIAIAVTVLFYILAFDNIFALPMRWLSLSFLLLIEVIGTAKALKFNKSILNAANIFVSFIHLGIVFVLSLVFVNTMPLLIKEYILLNLLVMAAVAAADILLLHFDKKAKESNDRYSAASAIMDECLVSAEKLLMEVNPEYKESINTIVEMLRYSNRASLCGNEADILAKLEQLHNKIKTKDYDTVDDKIEEIQNLIKLRTIEIKKKGKF